ncbi:helix-turn-helix transcriptional regulator [Paraburkholderia sp. PREW-6R]|uniref:helix-turn-helix domain-containing protein n=1 Tax=Paraburkholderia sp. PREW-6R TaxID=3141544 RepID=UPI0031F49416
MLHVIATPDQMCQLLAASRRQAGLTQTEAAMRVGISQSRISALETDAAALTLAQLLALCGVYGLQLQINDRTGEPNASSSGSVSGTAPDAGPPVEW